MERIMVSFPSNSDSDYLVRLLLQKVILPEKIQKKNSMYFPLPFSICDNRIKSCTQKRITCFDYSNFYSEACIDFICFLITFCQPYSLPQVMLILSQSNIFLVWYINPSFFQSRQLALTDSPLYPTSNTSSKYQMI